MRSLVFIWQKAVCQIAICRSLRAPPTAALRHAGDVRLRPCEKWVQLEAYAMPHVCGSADSCHVALTMLLSHSLKKE